MSRPAEMPALDTAEGYRAVCSIECPTCRAPGNGAKYAGLPCTGPDGEFTRRNGKPVKTHMARVSKAIRRGLVR